MASMNSNLLPRGEKGRDRIVDRVEFSGQLFMTNANGYDAFSNSARISYREQRVCNHDIFALAYSESGYS